MTEYKILSFVSGVDVINTEPIYVIGTKAFDGRCICIAFSLEMARNFRTALDQLRAQPYSSQADQDDIDRRRAAIASERNALHERTPDLSIQVKTIVVDAREDDAAIEFHDRDGQRVRLVFDAAIIHEMADFIASALLIMEGKQIGSNRLH